MARLLFSLTVSFAVALPAARSGAADWPMFGRDWTRNAVSPERNPPLDWDSAAGRNVKWSAALGSTTIGTPVVAGGLVWVTSNNEGHHDPSFTKDAGCLLCFDEQDGRFLWQHLSPRRGDRHQDWPYLSQPSPPLVEGERLWFVTSRWEVVCLDISPLLKRTGEPREVWKLDMPRDLGVFGVCPSMALNLRCAVGASYKGKIYVITGNGVDETYSKVPAPDAPSLVCIDKQTGKVEWKDSSPGPNILDSQCSSPLVGDIGGRGQVIAAMGDGWVRSFDPATGKLLWKFDLNRKGWAYPPVRSEVMATPIFYDGRVYVGTGQSVEQGEGLGVLWCIDPTKGGDVSEELDDGPLPDNPEWTSLLPGARPRKGKPNPNYAGVWRFETVPVPAGRKPRRSERMNRTGSSVTAADGLAFAADFSGYLHCLDARTGQRLWVHDLDGAVYGAPLVCDGKVYLGTEDGKVTVFGLARDKKLIAEREFEEAINSGPVFSNGVLYVATRGRLYAIAGPAAGAAPDGPAPRADGQHTGPRDAAFAPTPNDVVDRMLELATVSKDDVVCDLGCGDGRIVVAAARKYGCRAVGCDLDEQCVRTARDAVAREGLGRLVTIEHKDLFTADLSNATVVTLYLGREVNGRLVPRLQKLRPGARIVSNSFEIEGYPPEKTVDVVSSEDDTRHTLYLWTAPLKKARDK